jgi:hypothetical protein
MEPASVHRELAKHGIVVLAVLPDGANDDRLYVYLHGPAGKERAENVIRVLMDMADVVAVRCSEQTLSILIVDQRSAGPV